MTKLALALSYFLYYAAMGGTWMYLPIYLEHKGYSGREAGLILSVSPLVGSLMPIAWGFYVDRTRRPVRALRLAATGNVVTTVAIFLASGLATSIAAVFANTLFRSAAVPVLDSTTLRAHGQAGYGPIRAVGSVGFVLAVFGLGLVLPHDATAGRVLVPFAVAAALAWALSAFVLADVEGAPRAVPTFGEAAELFRRPAFVLLLAVGAVHWASLSPYHTQLAIHVEALGHGPSVAGSAFAFGALIEIGLILRGGRFMARPGLWLVASLAVTSLRWGALSVLEDPIAIVLLQGAHAFTFGAFYLAALALVMKLVDERLWATANAIFAAVVFGFGGGVGTLLAGEAYARFGGAGTFGLAGLVSLVATVGAVVAVRAGRRR